MNLGEVYRNQNYGTLLYPLTVALGITEGAVVELGAGAWSTPYLHQYCAYERRALFTVEPNDEWRSCFDCMESSTHLFLPAAPDTALTRTGVVLVDSMLPSGRALELRSMAADVFVLHDAGPTDVPNYPGLAAAIDSFPHTRLYDALYPATMLLSRTREDL